MEGPPSDEIDGAVHDRFRRVRRCLPPGQELRPIVFGLGAWGEKWLLVDPDPAELEPVMLMWHAHARLDTSELPDRRV